MSTAGASAWGEVDDATFDRDVVGADGLVLVEFFATWCGNCRRFASTLEELAGEYAGRVRFVKVDADNNPTLVHRYGVLSTPTLVLFEVGEPVGTLVGAQPEDAVRGLLVAAVVGRAEEGGPIPAPVGWVPVDACTLPRAEQPLRIAEFTTLFATALRGCDRRDPGWLRLRLTADSGVEAFARELTERESECCSFFDFQLTPTDGELLLDVRVPVAQVGVLDGIMRLAEAARARSAS